MINPEMISVNTQAYDPTNPNHYKGKIECWDYIISHNMNFLEGNVVKYVTRYKQKNGVEDLRKARTYLDKLIKECEIE